MAVIHLYDANGNILWLVEHEGKAEANLEAGQPTPLIASSAAQRGLSEQAVESAALPPNYLQYAALAQEQCAKEGDGLLVLDRLSQQVWIINADGSDGQFCANGLQATAFHIGEGCMHLRMGMRQIEAIVQGDCVKIILESSAAQPKKIEWRGVQAYHLNMPNPHLVFIQPPVHWSLLAEGQACCLELHTNVEWVQPCGEAFQVNVYERGAGVTAACGSGALAVFEVLRHKGQVKNQAYIKMPGGSLLVEAHQSHLSLSGKVRLLKSEIYKNSSL
jgi:diaminopimelate epimerase